MGLLLTPPNICRFSPFSLPRRLVAVVILFLFAILPATTPSALAAKPAARIGVLAYRGIDEAIKMWGPTALYLKAAVPDYEFSIVPLDFQEIGPAVANHEVEFVLANTSIYVELEARYGVTRIATLKNLNLGRPYTVFGGVIFSRADRSELQRIKDLKGRSLMAVQENSLGGWQIAWREMRRQGVDPYRDLDRLQFGGTHDRVVYAVRDGAVDFGTVRTDTLERMAKEGLIDLNLFRVINAQTVADFPLLLSSQLYPEWPFAKNRKTSDDLAQKTVIALLQMDPASPAAQAGKIAGWTTPLDYQPVHDLLRELRLPPYQDYGRITFTEVAVKYRYLFLAGVTVVLLLAGILLHVISLNRVLSQSKQSLEKTFHHLQIETSERKQVEEALLRAYQFTKTVLDSMNDAISIINVDDLTIAGANDKFLKEYNLPTEAAAIGKKCYELTHNRATVCTPPDDPCPLLTTRESGNHAVVEHRHCNPEGEERYVEVATSPIRNDQGLVVQVVHVARDITARKNLEASLAASREEVSQNNELLQAGLDGIFALIQEVIARKDFRVRFQKDPGENGGEAAASSPIRQIGEHFNQMMDVLEHQHQELEAVYSRVKTAQSHLLQQEKMASIGQLAAGVAHEINNPIGFIMSNLSTLRKYSERFSEYIAAQTAVLAKLPPDEESGVVQLQKLRRALKIDYLSEDTIGLIAESLEGAERVRTIVQNLKSFSRLDESELKMADLNAGLESTINIVWNELKYKATVVRDYGPLPPTLCNLGELNQVFMNLLVNAAQAIEKQGEIRVSTWMADRQIHVAIGDTGSGIPAEKIHRIFEPFYTTKEVGQGTGLGLSIAYDIVKKHGGEIGVTTLLGQGTTFTVTIPLVEG